MHNCDLVNLEDMLQNGTVISGTLIEKPHSFSTACNIATQIIAQIASNQYGGQSISLTHLASFVNGLSTHDFHIAQLPADAGIVRVYGAGSFLGIGRIDHAAATVTPEKVIANPQDFHNR